MSEGADLQAAIDQAIAASAEIARAMAGYHGALLEQGFDRTAALTLTVAFQTQMLSQRPPED